MIKIKLNKIKIFFKKLPKILAEKAFLTFLGLLFISLIFGILTFYQYSVLAGKEKPEISEKPLQFKEKTYQEILKTWQERDKKFEETETKEYSDPFQGLTE